ncbi:hypothetical protein KBC89_04795 [Candidatus Woesebacteria bacterium]|nr:hypothetical protein [Candidatus Woesebacteria bacterium]
MKKSVKLLSRYWVLVLLVSLYVLNRLPLLFFQTFAFTFDHGKDSLAVMDLVTSLSPKLIGPWTSIPGLYFGPGWYYLLAPLYWLLNFHPLAGPLTMMLLGLVQLIVVYKYFGKLAALILTSAPIWFITTTNASNPYPLTLVTWLILILLEKIKKYPKKTTFWLLLGAGIGMGFHFSTAFAVLYVVLVPISIWLRKIKPSSIVIGACLLGFSLPFIPQGLFELRHNFSETRAVLSYLSGEANIEIVPKSSLLEVVYKSVAELKLSVFTGVTGTKVEDAGVLALFCLSILWAIKRYGLRCKTNISLSVTELLIWSVLTIAWLSLTHFNTWYLVGLMPLVVVFFSRMVKKIPRPLLGLWIVVLLIAPFLSIGKIYFHYSEMRDDRSFLPVKLKTIETVYQIAGDKPFASFQYAPHIYDFDWQYLYFWRAANGDRLPTEFAYEPNVVPYIVEKPDLLNHFSSEVDGRSPEIIFYIVEEPMQPSLLVSWWQRQQFERIVETIKISDEVTLYMAEPKIVQY